MKGNLMETNTKASREGQRDLRIAKDLEEDENIGYIIDIRQKNIKFKNEEDLPCQLTY